MEGSSSSMSFRPLMKARPTASICCSPPLRVPAFWCWRSASREKIVKNPFHVAFDAGVLSGEAGQPQVLHHREIFEQAPSFGHVGDGEFG